jgi:hypothetical protein
MWIETRFPVRFGRFSWLMALLLGLTSLPTWAQQAAAQEPADEIRTTGLEREPGVVYRPVVRQGQTTPDTADAPPVTQAIIAEFERQKSLARIEMEQKIAQQRLQVVAQLKDLAAKLDQTGAVREAQAVRDYLQKLQPAPVALPDPGSVQAYRDRVGQTFIFEIVGQAGSTIWGDGVYTDDSPIAVAAVHAGIVRVGERALVQVRIQPGQQSYEGADRNGIHSNPYAVWQGSYTISAFRPGLVFAPAPKANIAQTNASHTPGRA